MIDFIKTKNFTFECESSAYGDSIDITVDVCLCGKANRFYLDTVKAMNVGKAINKFLDDWFQTAMPSPCANYIGTAKLVNYNPAAAIAHGRQLGKPSITKTDAGYLVEEFIKPGQIMPHTANPDVQVIPPYSTITSDRDEAAILYSTPESRDEWVGKIMDEACVKAMADACGITSEKFKENEAIEKGVAKYFAGKDEELKNKIIYGGFTSCASANTGNSVFTLEMLESARDAIDGESKRAQAKREMFAAYLDAARMGTGFMKVSDGGICRVDPSEVTKEPKK